MNSIADIFANAPVFAPRRPEAGANDDEPYPVQPRPDAACELEIGSDVEIAHRVAADLRERHGQIVFDEGEFWYFGDTHWMAVDRGSELRIAVHRYDGAAYQTNGERRVVRLSKGRIDSALNEMAALLRQNEFFARAATGINCKSGFIRFDAQGVPTLETHRAEHRARHVLPGSWPVTIDVRRAETSMLARLLGGSFLGESEAGAKVALLGELAGAAALGYSTHLKKPKACILMGERAENGKSQVLDLLRGLLPLSAVASVPPHKFSDEKFIIGLMGKLLNASDELTSAAAIGSDIFKSAVTGEPVGGRDVYRSMVMFRPVALHVYATNDLPSFRGGMDRGVIRRLMVVPFSRVIPEDERIDQIGQRIAREEADLLLDWAVQGATCLIARGRYEEPPLCKTALVNWCLGADPVQAWLDTVRIEEGEYVPRILTREAFAVFRDWAIAEGYRSDTLPAVNNFAQRVIAQRPEVRLIRPGNRSTLVGLALPGSGCLAVA